MKFTGGRPRPEIDNSCSEIGQEENFGATMQNCKPQMPSSGTFDKDIVATIQRYEIGNIDIHTSVNKHQMQGCDCMTLLGSILDTLI